MPLSDTQHTLHGCIHLKGRARRSSKSNDGRKCVCTGKQSCSIHKLKIMTKIDVKNDVKFIVSSSFYSYNQHIHIYINSHMLGKCECYFVWVCIWWWWWWWHTVLSWDMPVTKETLLNSQRIFKCVFLQQNTNMGILVCLFACFRLLSLTLSLALALRVFSLSFSFKVANASHNLLLMQATAHSLSAVQYSASSGLAFAILANWHRHSSWM